MSSSVSNRRHSRRRQSTAEFGTGHSGESQPWFVSATDVCLWSTVVAVSVCFGGRTGVGQLVFVVGANITAACWLFHLLTNRNSKYYWTGSEWLWGLGILVALAQLVSLPQDWLLTISPQLKETLPLWFDSQSKEMFPDGWTHLSLAPNETASGLATFVSYMLIFLVSVQRMRTLVDVQRMLCGVVLMTTAMAVFALVQYFTGNGRFFWFYQHPYVTTDNYTVGCFTNRNHLAQYLVLGVSPAIWWLLNRIQNQDNIQDASDVLPPKIYTSAMLLQLGGLGACVLGILLTLSRGGLLSLGVSVFVGLTLMCRIGLASIKLVLVLMVAGTLTGCVFFLTGYEALIYRIERAGMAMRYEVWQANIKLACEFPIFGTGIGTHADSHQMHLIRTVDGYEFTHAESGYLQIASETGFVGFVVAVLFVMTCLFWCVTVVRDRSNSKNSGPMAVFLASLLANAVHASFDFFWYTPACMLLLAIQLAGVCQLYNLARESSGRVVWTWRLPPSASLLGLSGVLVLAAWMVYLKLPTALAEPDQMRYITLSLAGPAFYADAEEHRAAQHEKRLAAIRAAQLAPDDSRLQETAALAYIEWFNDRQGQSENTFSLVQLRGAIKASEFESPAAMHEWLNRAVGKNVKLLRRAVKCLRLALRESPLRADSYVHLAELGFLDAMSKETESAYLKQAVLLRPHHPAILFAVGQNDLLAGNLDRAMDSWRVAFKQSPRFRGIIIELLAPQVTPDFFIEKLKPDWSVLDLLAQAFTNAGRKDEARQVWQRYVREGDQQLRTALSDVEYQSTVLALRSAHQSLQEPKAAITLVSRSLKRLPYSVPLRQALGMDLLAENRFGEAAEHLQWCAARQPDDQALQQAAARAVKERLKSTGPLGTNIGGVPRVDVTR